MSDKKLNFFELSPYFVSSRTHFKFLRRCCQWMIGLFSLFSQFFSMLFESIPLWGTLISLVDKSFDALAFGTNRNLGPFSQALAFIGYGCLILSVLGGLFISGLANIPSLVFISTMLSLYFEAATIINWQRNHQNLQWASDHNELEDPKQLENAQIMVKASVITFVSMFFKAISLPLSILFPTAAICIFVVAQIAEISAMVGSLGKETVNIQQNIDSLRKTAEHSDDYATKLSYNKINKMMPTVCQSKVIAITPPEKKQIQLIDNKSPDLYPAINEEIEDKERSVTLSLLAQ